MMMMLLRTPTTTSTTKDDYVAPRSPTVPILHAHLFGRVRKSTEISLPCSRCQVVDICRQGQECFVQLFNTISSQPSLQSTRPVLFLHQLLIVSLHQHRMLYLRLLYCQVPSYFPFLQLYLLLTVTSRSTQCPRNQPGSSHSMRVICKDCYYPLGTTVSKLGY